MVGVKQGDAWAELRDRVLIFCGWFVQLGVKIATNPDFVRSVAIILAALILQACASSVLATNRNCVCWLFGLELIAAVLPILAWYFPTASMRFTFGLNFCVYGLHAGVCSLLWDGRKKTVPPLKEARMTVTDAFFYEMGNMLCVNIFRRARVAGNSRLPRWDEVARMLTAFAMCDSCMYLIREWLPLERNVSPGNRYYAESLLFGLCMLAGIECLGGFWTALLGLVGAELPQELQHSHPLLSRSLTEFWGLRWNPLAAKLLQDSFYKPLRRLGASQVVSILGCFAGSAVLHALPVYLANQSLTDTAMMAAFFLLQALCVLAELAVCRRSDLTRPHQPAVPGSEGRSAAAAAVSSYQTATELLLVVSILTGACYLLELWPYPGRHPSAITRAQCATTAVLSYVLATALYLVLQRSHYAGNLNPAPAAVAKRDRHGAAPPASLRAAAAAYLGWAWALACILLLLPLLAQPILRATQGPHSRSYLVGPLVRAYYSR